MDSGNHPERAHSEQPDFPNQQHERTGSMSLGAPPTGDDVSPINGDTATTSTAPVPFQDPNAKVVHDVINSEIGILTLLNRLKQSIASAKEFALFLKKRSTIEEEHSNGLKKLCRTTSESIRKPDQRHGSFLQAYDEVNMIHDRMADNGAQFSLSLHQMHVDLLDMVANMERHRKHWKANGLAAEQRVADTELALKKSKDKYDSLAEDYDRARTGDRQATKKFGLKGPKSAAQQEEDLLRKVQGADADYATKVQAAQSQRAELWSKTRPEAVKSLVDLVKECDAALTLQMQKFASFNEKLLLSNGLNVSPLKGAEQGKQPRSLRESVLAIDNDKDFNFYISSFGGKLSQPSEIKYEKHPVLQPVHSQVSAPPQRQSDPPASFNSRQGPPLQSFGALQSPQYPQPNQSNQPYNNQPPPPAMQHHERSFSQGQPPQQYNQGPPSSVQGPPRGPPSHGVYNTGSISSSGPPQLSTLPFQTSKTPPPLFPQQQIPSGSYPQQPGGLFSQQQPAPFYTQPNPAPVPVPASASAPAPAPYLQNPAPSFSQSPVTTNNGNLPPLKPVFGLSLEQLFERDGSAVPMIVYQCIQAVDLFGLEVEGIYRLSGTASHITKIKSLFDNDASKVDFRNPESFFHDVNSVAGLLKQFFRELPDPLLTAEHYAGFIEAAKNEDDIVRRDSLHAIINSLPDPNYATLRALTLHLNRIQEASASNRMNASNLAIVFGPTLMGANTGPNIQDAGWQVRVVDTILNNTYQIFDDD